MWFKDHCNPYEDKVNHISVNHFSADFILFYVEKQVHTLSLTSHYYFLGSPWCSCGASFGIGLAVSISYPWLPFLEHLGLHLSLMKMRKWLVIPFKFFYAEFNMPRVRWYFWSVFVYSIKGQITSPISFDMVIDGTVQNIRWSRWVFLLKCLFYPWMWKIECNL